MRLLVTLLLAASTAIAQDRSLTVMESSVVVRGADVTITADGGCEASVRIEPVADQRASTPRRLPASACTPLKASLLRCAKLDQGVGAGAAP